MSFRKILWVLGFSLVLIPFLSKTAAVQAQGSRSKPASGRTGKVVLRVTVEGELQTAKMGSDIKSEGSTTKGGDASQYAVKVTRAMGKDGKELSEIEGKILHLHRNSKSQSESFLPAFHLPSSGPGCIRAGPLDRPLGGLCLATGVAAVRHDDVGPLDLSLTNSEAFATRAGHLLVESRSRQGDL